MAAEESGSSPAPPPASNPILPHYPELIYAAIEAIDSKNGANKSRISKQIEASYGSLPAAHKTLISHHLNKMRASGELVVIKNNYVKNDPNSPPPRGRGRPPKPKEPVPEGTVVSPPRPRGRPRKSEDTLNPVSSAEETAAAPSVSGRKRGRPPKVGKEAAVAPTMEPLTGERRGRGRPRKEKRGRGRPRKEKTDTDLTPLMTATGEKKGRGRPRKVKTDADLTPLITTGEKKGRGRPRKVRTDADSTPATSTGEKKGRGRPPKVKTAAVQTPAPENGERRGRGRPPKVKAADLVLVVV